MIALYLSIIDDEIQQNKFEQLYYQYKNLMYYVAFQVLRNRQNSEDAVQEVFLRVAKNMDKIGSVESTETKNFIAIITKREAMKIYNKQVVKNEETDVDWSQFRSKSSDNLVNEVEDAIRALPYRYSSLLQLKYVFGYSGKEIAQITGLSEGNVRKQLYDARKRLDNILHSVK